MHTTITGHLRDKTICAPAAPINAIEPGRGPEAWYYGQACAELAELRTKERNRRLAHGSGFAGNSR